MEPGWDGGGGGDAIKFETVEPHLKYLRLIFCGEHKSFDTVD